MTAPFSFGFAPGTVLSDAVPRGYEPLRARSIVGGAADFDRLARDVFAWRVQRGSGLRVVDATGADAPEVTDGQAARVVLPLIAIGALRVEIAAPVRVSTVVREPDRVGFAYGTLPGHPEHGEEAWLLERADGQVTLTVRALSKPALPYSLMPWVGRALQRRFTDRYLRALIS